MRASIIGLLAAAALAATMPGVAFANTGVITVTSNSYAGTPGYANLGVSVSVTKTTCDWGSTYCGWFPVVRTVDPAQTCPSALTSYVGEIVDGLGTYTQDLGTSLQQGASTRLCLYISSSSELLVAQTIVKLNSQPPPAPTPPPAEPPPTTQPSAPKPLKVREARAALPRILKRKYGARFKQREHYRRSCSRWSTQKVRCTVRWDYAGKWRYRGAVSMRTDPDDADSILYWTNIHRKRLYRPKPKPNPPAPPPQNCDPNYSGCLDPNAYDYDCVGGSGDGPRYTGPVRILGDDHYDLDRDGDGVGCEDD